MERRGDEGENGRNGGERGEREVRTVTTSSRPYSISNPLTSSSVLILV